MIHDDCRAGPEHKMKGIAEDDLGTGIANLLRVQTLYTAVGTHWHECRRGDFAPGELHSTGTGFTVDCFDFELHVAIRHRFWTCLLTLIY